jgi:hypothetical protein
VKREEMFEEPKPRRKEQERKEETKIKVLEIKINLSWILEEVLCKDATICGG